MEAQQLITKDRIIVIPSNEQRLKILISYSGAVSIIIEGQYDSSSIIGVGCLKRIEGEASG